MSRFVAKCPVEGCGFKKESHWENSAGGVIVLHLYQMNREGHWPKSSRPEKNFKVREAEGR